MKYIEDINKNVEYLIEYPFVKCRICGYSPSIEDTFGKCDKGIMTEFLKRHIGKEHSSQVSRLHVPLKPWKDPESLFCSPKLKEIIGKEPLRGEECRSE
jgi:hypothetical protein